MLATGIISWLAHIPGLPPFESGTKRAHSPRWANILARCCASMDMARPTSSACRKKGSSRAPSDQIVGVILIDASSDRSLPRKSFATFDLVSNTIVARSLAS